MFFRVRLPAAMLTVNLVIEPTAKDMEKFKAFLAFLGISKMQNSILFKSCWSLPLPLSFYV